MMHQSIMKRKVFHLKPKWKENGLYHITNVKNEVVKYGEKKFALDIGSVEYINVIENTKEYVDSMIYWEGVINQEVLSIGERVMVDDETFAINDVIKNINGDVIYFIDDLIMPHEDYKKLLRVCEELFDLYSY